MAAVTRARARATSGSITAGGADADAGDAGDAEAEAATTTTTATTGGVGVGVGVGESSSRYSTSGTVTVDWDAFQIRNELRSAAHVLSQYCLKRSAKWVCEQLIGLPEEEATAGRGGGEEAEVQWQSKQHQHQMHEGFFHNDPIPQQQQQQQQQLHGPTSNTFSKTTIPHMTIVEQYAKSLLELGEYSHAAAVLSQSPPNASMAHYVQIIHPPLDTLTSYGIYLRAYSIYLCGEQRMAQDALEFRGADGHHASSSHIHNHNLHGGASGSGTTASGGTTSASTAINPYLEQLAKELGAQYAAGRRRRAPPPTTTTTPNDDTNNNNYNNNLSNTNQSLDAFGLYVYGIVLRKRGDYSKAASVLQESLRMFPWNWSAWLDMAELQTAKRMPSAATTTTTTTTSTYANEMSLEQEFAAHYMYHFYSAHVLLQNHQNHEAAITVYERLLQGPHITNHSPLAFSKKNTYIPDDPMLQQQQQQQEDEDEEQFHSQDQLLFGASPYVASQLAVAHYHLRDFALAEHLFQQIHARDPHRLEELDIYSNILYVHNASHKLSQLAHTAMRVDKYRPETCCIVGNYYSLKQLRTKAITYFGRALKLNPTYTGAWTLMGHEYVELKNTPAAMESYRKAADISPHDYRAWYGLGQAYEILNMPLYALHYYQKAVTIRPYDARMWSAVAACYLSLNKRRDAIASYEKALADDVEGIATSQLAQLYVQEDQPALAATCFQKHLRLRYLATTTATTATTTTTSNTTLQQQQQQQSSQHGDGDSADDIDTTNNDNSPNNNNNNNNSSRPDRNDDLDHDNDLDLIQIISGVVVQAPEARALLFLANYFQRMGELETAALCASRLLEYPGPEKEEGKAVLREIRSRRSGSSTTTSGGRP